MIRKLYTLYSIFCGNIVSELLRSDDSTEKFILDYIRSNRDFSCDLAKDEDVGIGHFRFIYSSLSQCDEAIAEQYLNYIKQFKGEIFENKDEKQTNDIVDGSQESRSTYEALETLIGDSDEPLHSTLDLDATYQKLCDMFDPNDSFGSAKEFYKCIALFSDVKWEGTNLPLIPFDKRRPSYRDLTGPQFMYYLYWRTNVLEGNFIKTDISYIYLYIYELLAGFHGNNAENILNKLIEIYDECACLDSTFEKYVPHWVLEYAMLNDILPQNKTRLIELYSSHSVEACYFNGLYEPMLYSYIMIVYL